MCAPVPTAPVRHHPAHLSLAHQDTMTTPQSFTGQLKLRVIEASGLVAPDGSKTIDPYLTVSIDEAAVFQTSTKSKTSSPKWNEDVGLFSASS